MQKCKSVYACLIVSSIELKAMEATSKAAWSFLKKLRSEIIFYFQTLMEVA